MFQIGECGKYFVKNLPRLSVVARRALNDRRIERSHAGDGDALRESQEDFRGPVEASTEFVWTAAEDGTSSDLFRWFSQVSGRTIDDLDGIASLIHPADLEPIRSMWASSGTEGKLFEITARFLTKYGEYMYYVVRSIPIHNEDGTFRHWVGTFTDVNEQLAAIEHLRKSENHLRAMVESDPKCVKVLDREGRLVTINPAGVRMMEADSQDAIVGTAVCELVIPEHRDKFNAMIAGAFEGKEASQVFEIVGLKGSHRILESHVVPLRGRDGDIVSALGVTQDITEQRRREETLRQQAMLLDQAWEAIFVWNFR
ncbi:MAG: PAS domain-containing protein [Pyrinomonadaceae bacterium]